MITCQRDKFDLEDDVTYLNMAYMSPLLKSSVEIGIQALKRKSRPYDINVDDFFTPVIRVKEAFSRLVDAINIDSVAIIPSISYAIANAAKNIPLQSGDRIIVLEDQFPSNFYSWKNIAEEKGAEVITIMSPVNSEYRGDEWTQAIIDQIDHKTKVVAMPHVHWSDGTKFNLKAIREKLDMIDGYLVIDGTQSIGALPFSIQDIRPDVLAVSAYKWLLGPYGIGLAYYNDRFYHGKPIEHSWINRLKSDEFSRLVDYQDQFRPGSSRYSVGEHSNFSIIPMVEKGISQILDWEVETIQSYCKEISFLTLEELNKHGFKTLPSSQRGAHLFGIKIPPQIPPKSLATYLKDQKIHISVRGSYIRVSPYLYNSKEDFIRLQKALIDALHLF